MATIAAKAERRARVNQRLATLSGQIAETFGVEIPPASRTTRDPELDQIIELERIANIFDRILNGETEQKGGNEEDLESLKLDELKERAITAGHDADTVNSKRSKKDIIAILNGETEQEEGEG